MTRSVGIRDRRCGDRRGSMIGELSDCCLHRRRARAIAERMSQTTLQEARGREPDSSSQPNTFRRSGSRARKSAPAAAVAATSATPGVVRSLRSSPWAIPALMDLALPKFAHPEKRSERPQSPWIVMNEVTASPAPVRLRVPLRSPSPCLNLDTLSSDGLAGPGDVSDHPICISYVSCHSGDPDQVLSEDDLPPEVRMVDLPPEVRIIDLPPGVRAVDLTPDDRVVDLPPEGCVEAISTVMLQGSARMSPCSPPVYSLDQSVVSSMVISPNRVSLDTSPDIPDAEPVFEVSPDTSGYFGISDATVIRCCAGTSKLGSDSYSELMLGDPVAFTLSGPIPGLDAPPMTFPVYPLPSGLALLPGQSSVQMILASAVSSRPDGWSTGVPRTYDVSREGPFDAYCLPMDTGDSPLVATGLQIADTNPAYAMQLHHPQFLEFIRAPESARLLYHSPAFWVQRMGEEDAVAAAINLQRDARVMLLNLQILSQFVTSLHQMSTEMLNLRIGHVVFPRRRSRLCLRRRGRLGRHSIWLRCLWRPQTGPGDPGPVPALSCNACMNCRYCFPEGPVSSGK